MAVRRTARSGHSTREKCSARKSGHTGVEEREQRERELLSSGARQARINCRVIYRATDFLGKFSTEVRVIEKLDCSAKAIKFLYGVADVDPNRFSLRQPKDIYSECDVMCSFPRLLAQTESRDARIASGAE